MSTHRLPDLHPLTIFRFLWAFAMLFHMLPQAIIAQHPASIPVVILAVVVIVRPQSQRLFVLLALAQLVEVAFTLPEISNHWTVVALVNLIIVGSAAWLEWQQRQLHDDDWYVVIAAGGRWLLIVLYFFVTFHKLNSDFFNPAVSCAIFRYENIAGIYSLPMGGAVDWLVMVGTIIVEGSIPLLLIFRRTCYIGIALGLAFHGMLGLDYFFDFGSLLIALYSLFLAPDFARALVQRHPAIFRHRSVLRILVGGIALIMGFFGLRGYIGVEVGFIVFSVFCWIPYVIIVLYLFLTTAPHAPAQQSASELLRPRSALVGGVVLLAFINGWLPYVGIKNQYSFEMFSNLRVENNVSNHWWIPASWQQWDYTSDLVYVEETDMPSLVAVETANAALPRIEFNRRMLRAPADTFATIEYDGERQTLSTGETLGTVDWRTRWLSFEAVEFGETVNCTY